MMANIESIWHRRSIVEKEAPCEDAQNESLPEIDMQHPIQALIQNIEQVIIGKRPVIELATIALICRGHVLIEDVPGTGKTILARALARSIALDTKRLQCTPDLLPSDITGVPIYNQKTGEFEFRAGPVFTHILLADEINRATPRAQSALLECMEEFRVSVDGNTYKLPQTFMVLATQNPIEMAGTHPLPEAQLDRFFVKLSIGYPGVDEEIAILYAQAQQHPIDRIQPVIAEADILKAREEVKTIHVSEDVARYAATIVAATRSHPDLRLGASTRGTLALVRGSQGFAYLYGNSFVTPDIIKIMAVPTLQHRLIIRPQAAGSGRNAGDILREILDTIPPPI